ncbi:nitronate monooxygenase family protein [Legionella sp. 16cNR16C]|uniref:NAD(P)H-dependent flavin oxidoreductase n=1 Tax=Legionella sp. 16cNR16C TaxID=2905656 RepID=UPI001E63D040|nr:nitronate monooxygenase [Legionella sp. 16cNR16C]MCE3045246.1 nitronate monooxygenase [Legionella sp. 16cNR16C]
MKPLLLSKQAGSILPVIQAPMAGGITTPELAAAVSNCGGLGSIGAGYLEPEALKKHIQATKRLTSKPFAVNLFIPEKITYTDNEMLEAVRDINRAADDLKYPVSAVSPPFSPDFDKQLQVVVEEKVPVFSFTFGVLKEAQLRLLKANNIFVYGTATSLPEAKMLAETGVDAVCLQGLEAGGHRGSFIGKEEDNLIPIDSLLKTCLDSGLKLPCLVAGGIASHADVEKHLRNGAHAVQVGSLFLTAHESGTSHAYKQAVLNQFADKTRLTRAFSGKLARGVDNRFMNKMQNAYTLPYPAQNKLTSQLRNYAKQLENAEYMSLWAGTSSWKAKASPAAQCFNELIGR